MHVPLTVGIRKTLLGSLRPRHVDQALSLRPAHAEASNRGPPTGEPVSIRIADRRALSLIFAQYGVHQIADHIGSEKTSKQEQRHVGDLFVPTAPTHT